MEKNEDKQEEKVRVKSGKVITSAIAGFVVLIFIVIASQSESFPLLWLIVIPSLIGLGLLFWWLGVDWLTRYNEMKSKMNEDAEIPDAVLDKDLFAFVDSILKSPEHMNMFRGYHWSNNPSVGKDGKNTVFIGHLDIVFERHLNWWIVVNRHDMHRRYAVLKFAKDGKKHGNEIMAIANRLAISPEKEPDKVIVEEENPLLGINRRTTSTKSRKQKEKKEESNELE